MKNPSAFKSLCSVIFSTFGYALILGGFGAIVSDLLNWNLALSIGGSDIGIPADRYAGGYLIVIGILVSLITHFWGVISAFIKKHKAAFITIIIILVAGIVFGGKQLITYLDGGPAITAAMNNDVETLQKLFEKGEVSPDDYDAMMMWTAQKGHAESMKLLLEKGANPNATREDGLTAMEAACAWGGQEVIILLQEYGAEGACQ